jgi:hypothetical protein
VGVKFRVDESKRHAPEARECWFEIEHGTTEEIATFSREGAQDMAAVQVESSGWATNWAEILKGAGRSESEYSSPMPMRMQSRLASWWNGLGSTGTPWFKLTRFSPSLAVSVWGTWTGLGWTGIYKEAKNGA